MKLLDQLAVDIAKLEIERAMYVAINRHHSDKAREAHIRREAIEDKMDKFRKKAVEESIRILNENSVSE